MDTLTPEKRSWLMSHVRSTDTSVELRVRRLVHGMGYRYRLYRANLPGKPDLVFASRRSVIFVHGCFWHRHPDCRYASMPKTRTVFWQDKFAKNVERDERNIRKLTDAGWSVLVVWQCELKNLETLARKIHDFLEGHQTRQSA